MERWRAITKALLSQAALAQRTRLNLTQEEMAELLHISCRAYGDLERSKNCFSSVSLMFFLSTLDDGELLLLVEQFRRLTADGEVLIGS